MYITNNVSVLHQDEGGIGKSIPDAREISRDPRDFPRAKPEGNLEGRGKSRGRRGWISQYLPSFGGVRTFSSSSILSLGMDQEIHPSRQGRIDSVKINPSLPMMRECTIHPKILYRKVAIGGAEGMRVEVSIGINVGSTWNIRCLPITRNAESQKVKF